jgi:cytochrome c biogenesis protein ResB
MIYLISRSIAILFLLGTAFISGTLFMQPDGDPYRPLDLAVFAVFGLSIYGCLVLLTRRIE